MLAFHEEGHEYRWAGTRVPSVTQAMESCRLIDYSMIRPEVMESARQQGKAVHRMVELHCRGDLGTLPAWLTGYSRAWFRFVEESGFELWQSEYRMYHERYGYAGTSDLIGLPTKFRDPSPAVLDLKRSFAGGAAIGIQLSAYRETWNHEFRKERDLQVRRRYGLRLDENGSYKCHPFEDDSDFGVFLACLQIHRWKAKNR